VIDVNVRTILIGGVIASLVIAMWEMVVEAILPAGAGFFGPPIAIGATIMRDLQGSQNPIPFDLAALVLGLAGHMMNSVILAAIFGFAVGRRGLGRTSLLVAGFAWGIVVFAGMWFVVVPVVDPLVLNLNGVAFLAGHMMWGATIGVLWARVGTPDRGYALTPA
jgi:hypothetical protein